MEVNKSIFNFLSWAYNFTNFKYKQRRRYHIKKIRKGTPCHLEWEFVNKVCKQKFDRDLISIENQKLSGWKKTGTYRLLITLEDWKKTSLIYRHCDYNTKDFPALISYPVKLGPAEYEIAKTSNNKLMGYLPKTYWVDHNYNDTGIYRYIQEDLSLKGYDSISGLDKHIIQFVVLLKNKLNELNISKNIPKYDYNYSSNIVDLLIDLWNPKWNKEYNLSYNHLKNITKTFLEVSMHDIEKQLIHGDFNNANILVKPINGKYIFKIVDWEWAGIGIVHSDIAAYFRNANYPNLKNYISKNLKQIPQATLDYHYKWLNWAFMNRALIDISYMAGQKSVSKRCSVMNISKFIADSINNLKTAYDKIQNYL